ncbi:MAG: MFS transporter [Actinomycetota bacterium]
MRGARQDAARGNPYREIFRHPGARGFSAAGVLARVPMSVFGLGTILLITSATGRYGAAGTVAAAGSVGYAVCAPQEARLADRFGQQRVLRPLAVIFAVSTAVFIGCAELRAPLWALLVSGAVAGASMPSLGSMIRARWSVLLGDSPQLHTAFALESVNDEMIFVAGPVIVTLLATEVRPAAGVAAAMLLCVTGTLLLAAQPITQPAAPGREERPPRETGRDDRARRAGRGNGGGAGPGRGYRPAAWPPWSRSTG